MFIQEDYFKNIFNTVRESILILDENMRVVSANRSFFNTFKVDPEDTIGSLLYDLGNGQWNIPYLRVLLEDILPKNDTVDDYKIEHNFESIGQKTMLLNACKITVKKNDLPIILLAIEDITERMKLEEAHSKLAAIVEFADDAIIGEDLEGIIVSWNKGAEIAYGYNAKEIVGKSISLLMPPSHSDEYKEVLAKIARGETIKHYETQRKRKDGQSIAVSLSISPVKDRSGKIITASTIARDITERREIEKGLEKARKELAVTKISEDEAREYAESIINTVREPLIALDHDLRVVTASRSFYEVFKVTSKETVGQLIYDLGNKQWNIPKLRELLETILPEKATFDNYEVEHEFSTIGRRIMLLNARQIKRVWGKERIILLAIEDITERKRLEDLLTESEKRYRRVFETASDGIVLLEKREGIIAQANPAAEKMMGYSEEECIGKKLQDIGVPLDMSNFPMIMKDLDKRGIINYDDVSVKTKSGQYIHTDIYMVDRARLAQCNIREITERKKLEAQLIQAQKMEAVGLLAGGIAHDFNNILSAIVGYGYLLQMKMNSDDPLRENVDQILISADRATEVTHSLLAFSRKQLLNPKPININALMKRLEKLLSRLIGEDIELSTNFTDKDVITMADAGQIEQVLLNLATNARDAMPHGGHLTLDTQLVELDDSFIRVHGYGEPGTFAVISVSDTGSGMDKETMAQIFEPFFTTKEVEKGTGLGLAMAYGIIKQHNGYINVYSEPEMGTTFRIYLPAIKSTEEVIVRPAIEPLPSRWNETILVAEDDAALRNLFSTILQAYGYKVILAKDGEEAIKKFIENKDKIHLAMLDMIMPKKSGKEVYDSIKKIRPDIRTLFSSGYTADRIDKDNMPKGGFDFIMKPVSPKELLKKIREVLDK